MASIKDMFKKIMNYFNKIKKLPEGKDSVQTILENSKEDKITNPRDIRNRQTRREKFMEETKRIYSKEHATKEMLRRLGANEEIINNEVALRKIRWHITDIMRMKGKDSLLDRNNAITQEELENMLTILQKSGNKDKIYLQYDKQKGIKDYGIRIDEKGNVVLDTIHISPDAARTLEHDEYRCETISIDEKTGNVNQKGFAVELNNANINLRNEDNANRDFNITYDHKGEKIKWSSHFYEKQGGLRTLVKEEYLDKNDIITEKDLSEQYKIFKMIDERGQEGIEELFNTNPDILSTLKPSIYANVMTKMLDCDLTNIIYDVSDDPKVYNHYVDKVLNVIKNSFPYEIMGDRLQYFLMENIKKEIEHPKNVPQGKYKIPHKYLFEGLRMGANLFKEKNDIDYLNSGSEGLGIGTCNNITSYLDCDGKYDVEFGEMMAKMYEDKDNYFLQHKYNAKRETGKEKECYVYGKKSSSHDRSDVNKLDCTTTGTYNKTMSFMGLLDQNGESRILMSIPKKAFDRNSDIPIWGADKLKENGEIDGDGYILPEYVIGSLNADMVFEKNPIPKEERKQYKYKFKDNSIKPMEEVQGQNR